MMKQVVEEILEKAQDPGPRTRSSSKQQRDAEAEKAKAAKERPEEKARPAKSGKVSKDVEEQKIVIQKEGDGLFGFASHLDSDEEHGRPSRKLRVPPHPVEKSMSKSQDTIDLRVKKRNKTYADVKSECMLLDEEASSKPPSAKSKLQRETKR